MVVALLVSSLDSETDLDTEIEIEIVSEHELKDEQGKRGFVDVLLLREREAVILELKYIPLPFAMIGQGPQSEDLLCTFVSQTEQRTESVDWWLTFWMDNQARKYARSLRFQGIESAGEHLLIESVKTFVLCGYGQRVKSLVLH
jgi:hypothetical protein